MDWIEWLEVVLSVVALGVAITALVPIVCQWWADLHSEWPFVITPRGKLKDPVGPWMITVSFSVRNLTSRTAYFEVRILVPGELGRWVPHHVSVWPKGDEAELYAEIPPRVVREVRVHPFGPQWSPQPKVWQVEFLEPTVRGPPRRFRWPEDLSNELDELATDIPTSPPE